MFKIQTNDGAITKYQSEKEISGNDARSILQNNIRVEKTKIENSWFNGRIDVSEARKNLKDLQRNYDRTSPESLSQDVQNALWKRAKQLKDEFTLGMLSHDELHPVKGIHVDGAIKLVVDEEKVSRMTERNTSWYNRNLAKIVEYKNIMRNLNPDNPMASDIEKFRPAKRTV